MDENHNIKMKLVFEEIERPFLLDITSLLYDFELSHDFSLLLTATEYSDYKFSQYFWYRNGRLLKSNHKLRAAKIVKLSPLTIELIITGVVVVSGALWVLVQVIEKVANWRLNTQKLRLEIEKLEIEIGKARKENEKQHFEQKMEERGATWIFSSLIGRLERNPLNLVDIEIETERKEDKIEH
jgi:hypothetical protein